MKIKLNLVTKTLLIKIFVVLMVVGMMDSPVFSQTRIKFARGKTSKTIKGNVGAVVPDDYVINGKRGQTMILRVSSQNGLVRIAVGDNASKEITIKLDSDHNYESKDV